MTYFLNKHAGVQLYLPYLHKMIPDYSMLYASQFYNFDRNHVPNNINDALWCQSANNITNIGVWYYPNGNEVPKYLFLMETSLIHQLLVQCSVRDSVVRLH